MATDSIYEERARLRKLLPVSLQSVDKPLDEVIQIMTAAWDRNTENGIKKMVMEGLPKDLKTYLTFHFYGVATLVSSTDGITKRQALQRIQQSGWAAAIDSFIEVGVSPQYRQRKDWWFREQMASMASSHRDAAIAYVQKIVEAAIDVLPPP